MKKSNITVTSDKIVFKKNRQETVFSSKYLEVDGIKVHYVETGKGENLLLLPGWPGSWRVYIELISKLSNKYHIFSPDLPGFAGKTGVSKGRHSLDYYVNFIDRFVNKINLKHFSILGISLGGVISLLYGNKYPNKVNKLAVQSVPYGRLNLTLPKSQVIKVIDLIFHQKVISRILSKAFKTYFLRVKINQIISNNDLKVIDKDIRKFIIDDVKKMDGLAVCEVAIDLVTYNITQEIKKMTIPTLVISGDEDRLIPISEIKKLSRLLPNCKLVIIEGQGHWLPVLKPKTMASHVDKFISEKSRG